MGKNILRFWDGNLGICLNTVASVDSELTCEALDRCHMNNYMLSCVIQYDVVVNGNMVPLQL